MNKKILKKRVQKLDIDPQHYFVDIVNPYGITLDRTSISEEDINKIIFTKEKVM